MQTKINKKVFYMFTYVSRHYGHPPMCPDLMDTLHNDNGNTMWKYKHMQCIIEDFNLPGFNWLEEEILDGPC